MRRRTRPGLSRHVELFKSEADPLASKVERAPQDKRRFRRFRRVVCQQRHCVRMVRMCRSAAAAPQPLRHGVGGKEDPSSQGELAHACRTRGVRRSRHGPDSFPHDGGRVLAHVHVAQHLLLNKKFKLKFHAARIRSLTDLSKHFLPSSSLGWPARRRAGACFFSSRGGEEAGISMVTSDALYGGCQQHPLSPSSAAAR